MYRKVLRILMIGISIEILSIIALVLIVFLLGPSDPEGAQAYAEQKGIWVGPIAGFIFCFAGGWFFSRKLSAGHITNGFSIGLAVAVIDVLLLIMGGSGFKLVFVVSNVGRLVAGSAGGWLAGKSASPSASEKSS